MALPAGAIGLRGTSVDVLNSALAYSGVVTAVPGANQFTIPTLAGIGAGAFADATAPYCAFVLRDAGGASAAPQGELQAITTYDSATGTFTTAAFTAAVAAGDEVIILNPRLALLALTNVRIARLDNLTGAVVAGTYNHPNGVAEQFPAALTFAAATRQTDVHLDLAALTQSIIIREYVSVDAIAWRQITARIFPADFDPGTQAVILHILLPTEAYMVSFQSLVAEGAARDIPYRYMTRSLA